jgi:hypothetical protein
MMATAERMWFGQAIADVANRGWSVASLAARAAWVHLQAWMPLQGNGVLGDGTSLDVHSRQVRGLPSDRDLMQQVRKEWADLDALLTHMRTKAAPPLPLFGQAAGLVDISGEGEAEGGSPQDEALARAGEFFAVLNRHYPEEAARVIADAEHIRRGEHRLLNLRFSFPGEVNWHLDPVSGKSWTKQYTGLMGRWFWTEKRTSDALPTWELNRQQHFVTLGRAYFLTGDERYAATCMEQIESWLAQNPPKIGVNWFSSLEIGMRLISWSIAFYLLRSSEAFAARKAKLFVKGLYRQTEYLWNHLTLDQGVPNNHLIGEVAALIVVGGLFPEFEKSETWVRTGLQILDQALHQQTHLDGVNKEQASGYHRFVLDLVCLVVLLGQCAIVPRSERIERVLERMLDYALYAMDPQGQLPQIGDSGDGWGLRLDMRTAHRDVRSWLAVGAVLFRRSDLKFGATTGASLSEEDAQESFRAEALWLLGGAGREIFLALEKRLPPFSSFAFREGGHYILRDSWDAHSDYAVFRSGEFGLGGEGACAHAHCDLLSLTLWMGGRPVLVDSGTYSYHGPWRSYFRLTPAHNTIRIDDRDQALPLNEFAWRKVPAAACSYYGERAVRGFLDVDDVRVGRHIRHPVPGLWWISDSLVGEGAHTVTWYFHFAPDLDLYQDDASGNWIVSGNASANDGSGAPPVPVAIITVPQGLTTRAERGWVSRHYGHKERNMQLVATWSAVIPDGGLRFQWEFKGLRSSRG